MGEIRSPIQFRFRWGELTIFVFEAVNISGNGGQLGGEIQAVFQHRFPVILSGDAFLILFGKPRGRL
jgi:hypothetical protein